MTCSQWETVDISSEREQGAENPRAGTPARVRTTGDET
jgi:hypothetical protein